MGKVYKGQSGPWARFIKDNQSIIQSSLRIHLIDTNKKYCANKILNASYSCKKEKSALRPQNRDYIRVTKLESFYEF